MSQSRPLTTTQFARKRLRQLIQYIVSKSQGHHPLTFTRLCALLYIAETETYKPPVVL